MRRRPVLAIDGPSGTGKTTSAAEAARRLGFAYVDSGALYRALAVGLLEGGVRSSDAPDLADRVASLDLRAEGDEAGFRVSIDGRDVTDRIREIEVTTFASKIAVHGAVRERVYRSLRELAQRGPAVVEGRDIGSVVFPDAELKVFLTASLEERVRRRALEMERSGLAVDRATLSAQMAERDARDSGRAIAPLLRAQDAVEIETTHTDLNGQVDRILEEWGKRSPPRRRWIYKIDQALIRSCARLLRGLSIEGAGRVPRAGGILIVANHKSYLDPPLVGSAIPREIHYLAKRELFSIPLLSTWIRAHNAIPIDREGFDRASMERALDLLRGGGALLVFPEGTRIRREGYGEPRPGVAWLAARARVPIVPAHLRGTWSGRKEGRRRPIRLRYGEPFHLPDLPPGRAGREKFPEVAGRIMGAIRDLGDGPDSG